MKSGRINLRIERLILEGLPIKRHEGPLVQEAIEAELARLLSAEGLDPSLLTGGAVPALNAGSIQLAAGTSPARMGQQIARAVYDGIRK